MKGLLANIGKNSGQWLLIVGLAPLAVACAHTIDPAQTSMPVYEMPAAVVVQTSPAPLVPWKPPMSGSGMAAAYASYPGNSGLAGGDTAPGVGITPGAMDVNGYPTGSTIVRQAPITVERPTIVVNQPPIWVGNPPVAIPQPPVVMHQTPITVDQPSFVIHPPKVGFQVPGVANTAVAETKPVAPVAPAPKVTAAVEPEPSVKAAPSKKAKSSHKKHPKKAVKKAAKKATSPAEALPPK